MFRENASMAERDGQLERARGARKYVADLERSLSTITIAVPEPVAGLVVTRGGRMIPRATFGVPVAADPGSYAIEALAPGHQGWSTTIELGAQSDRKTVTVPNLGSDRLLTEPGVSHGKQPLEDPDRSPGQDERPNAVMVTGVIVGGLGVISLGVGVALGAIAMSDTASSRTNAPTGRTAPAAPKPCCPAAKRCPPKPTLPPAPSSAARPRWQRARS